MAHWDRFDICEAHAVLEWDWHAGGWLHERPSNIRRGQRRGFTGEATSVQLARLGFTPAPWLRFGTLSRNGKRIYLAAVRRFGLKGGAERA